ncbi:MAG: hypothetical protein J6C50_04185 [Rickettsiales bacterium]|nr:hypothetical protein [Rickettsiales bacterium]
MHNLFLTIDSINVIRSNYNFNQLPKNTPNTFGSYAIKIDTKKDESPLKTREVITKTYFYIKQEYTCFILISI